MKSRSFRHLVEQELGGLPRFFIYAVLELTLMVILFLNGALAYVAHIFAELFELVPPCLLCTRVNPLFDRTYHDLHYNTTLCESHKKEISSFAYCHVHRKLSDLRTMCEACLLAFASEDTNSIASSTNDNSKDIECLFNDELRSRLKTPGHLKDDPALMQGNAGPDKPGSNVCSCCGEPILKAKSSFQKPGFPANNAPGWGAAQAPCSSPRKAFGPWKNEEPSGLELLLNKHAEPQPPTANTPSALGDEEGGNLSNQVKEDVRPDPITIPSLLLESEEMTEEFTRTPSFARGGNRFFNMLSGDSTTASPRFASRTPRKSFCERLEHIPADLFESVGVNEPEDSIANRMKRQMKLDRKSLIELAKELEEERSASAVAANNAMAMITRLQADKASVQMEALQYQRMMDEQAEYDQEALSALHDLLEKREYEMLDMHDELELYRERYGILGDVVRRTDHYDKVQSFSSFTEKSDHGDEDGVDDNDDDDGDDNDGHISPDESVFDIETDVDQDTGIHYYDQAYALYENEQLQGEEEQKDDVDEYEENEWKINADGGAIVDLEEQERSIVLDQLSVLEATNETSFENDDDQNTTYENDRGEEVDIQTENEGTTNDNDDSILINSEHENTNILDKLEVPESMIQNLVENDPNEEANDKENDGDGRNQQIDQSNMIEQVEVPEFGGEVAAESKETGEQVEADISKLQATDTNGTDQSNMIEQVSEVEDLSKGS